MRINIVSAEFPRTGWRAIKAFTDKDEADHFAMEIYEKQSWCGEVVFDSRVDEVGLQEV